MSFASAPPNTRQAGRPVTKQAATREELIGQFRTARRLSNLGAVGLACYALLFLALGALFALPRIREVYFWDEERFAWLVAAVASGAALVLFVLAAVSAAACAVFGLTWSFAVIAVFTVYILLNIIFAIIRI